ncbi:sulfhydryl oxidase 1-like isoform X2 [Phragmites australis]|uniref:sulfhydryl oxidase 1-like isoform X2 n=1 Tax=Phragmites australis TaxID=29695 RepID=UPI002D774F0D|nr:sulfhydryl oxidase 1-like isoform X2 [Phragmites australis]
MAATAARVLVALAVVAASLDAAPALRSLGVRDGAGAAGGGDADADAAVDLNATNFGAFLKASPESFAVVEFFAHWCPACRNYKPHYEKVAKLFNAPDAAHPGIIVMARVDCASKVNTDLCSRFSVDHYPFLLWGPPTKFASAQWKPKQDNSEIELIDDGRTSERLLEWINKKMGSSFSLDDKKYENENMLPKNASDLGQIVRAIYDVEEATAHAIQIILDHKMIKPQTRNSLVRILQILVAHHPSKRCRRGSADLLINFDDHWPTNLSLSSQESSRLLESVGAENHWICGKEVPRGYWMFCRGSKNETRGFSCGLWVLLHSLTVRIGDGESQSTFTSICDFIHNFFICEECRRHFYEMCSSVSVPFKSSRDLVLWLWSTHNKVDERLMKEEKELGTGDPSFPKVIWPPKQLCPSCYRSSSRTADGAVQVDWNEDEVFHFLVNYYGKMLVSSYKETYMESLLKEKKQVGSISDDSSASSAATVPIGAALGVAVASCTFGALACFWRTQQKNRKQRKNWN